MACPIPPGPKHLPILGSLPYLDLKNSTIIEETMRLSKELDSDVISLRIGPDLVVFLLSMDAVEEALSGEDFMDRPKMPFYLLMENMGLFGHIFGDETWKIHRLFLENLLKDNAADFEVKVHEEVGHLKDEFKKIENKAGVDPYKMLITTTGNIMTRKLFSKRFEYDDEKFFFMSTRMSNILRIFSTAKVLNVFPSVRHLSGNCSGWTEAKKSLDVYKDFVKCTIDERRDKKDFEDHDDFVAAYLAEQKKGTDATLWTDEQVIMLLLEPLSTGTEDVAHSTRWAILCMLKYPAVQKKIHKEIDDNIDKSANPKFEDRSKLPYTHASILEVQRVASQIPFLLQHTNQKRDVHFRGFTIPKETSIMANSYAVHRDPKLWKYPNVFNPGNFLDDDGKVVVDKRGFIPQSLGSRMCPAFNLVQMELFVIFASLMQAFEFTLPEGAPEPTLEALEVGRRITKPYEACVKPRLGEEKSEKE